MAIFAIIQQPGPNADKLPARIAEVFADAHLDVGNKVWLVAGSGTAQEISTTLGITGGAVSAVGSAIVLEAASYFGRGNPAIWSWIKSKWEATTSG